MIFDGQPIAFLLSYSKARLAAGLRASWTREAVVTAASNPRMASERSRTQGLTPWGQTLGYEVSRMRHLRRRTCGLRPRVL